MRRIYIRRCRQGADAGAGAGAGAAAAAAACSRTFHFIVYI